MKNIFFVFFIGLFSLTVSSQKARVKGVILDEFNNPVENVTVKVGDKGTVSKQLASAKAEKEYESFNKTQKIISDFDKEVKRLLEKRDETDE